MKTYQQTLWEFEAYAIERVLVENQHNKKKTAKILGMSRGTLHRKLVEHFGDKYVNVRNKKPTEEVSNTEGYKGVF